MSSDEKTLLVVGGAFLLWLLLREKPQAKPAYDPLREELYRYEAPIIPSEPARQTFAEDGALAPPPYRAETAPAPSNPGTASTAPAQRAETAPAPSNPGTASTAPAQRELTEDEQARAAYDAWYNSTHVQKMPGETRPGEGVDPTAMHVGLYSKKADYYGY